MSLRCEHNANYFWVESKGRPGGNERKGMAGSIEAASKRLGGEVSLSSAARPTDEASPTVLALADERARDASLVGAKTAALVKAKGLGLSVLPGFAITTAACNQLLARPDALIDEIGPAVRAAWAELSGNGSKRLVVRSSSMAEDGVSSSMAGMFVSVTDVSGWESFLDAVQVVAESSRGERAGGKQIAPIAVLVQPFLEAKVGGVLFGVDPVTGRSDHLVVATVEGSPEQLVSGEVQGTRYVLKKNGKVVDAETGSAGATLGGARRRALTGLAAHAERSFGSPQDVEWAIDFQGRLWMLQSRPVTATGPKGLPVGPVLGPGPVAETFPHQLTRLEEELWIDPLRDALVATLKLTKGASRRRIKQSPVITTVNGRVAADLDLLGASPKKASFVKKLDPRAPARRLMASWSVGRLRAALPALITTLIDGVDEELGKLPPLSESMDESLLQLLDRTRQTLVALHGHEVLAGMLMEKDATAPTGASIALRALAEARAQGMDDSKIATNHPVILALFPPRIGGELDLPDTLPSLPPPAKKSDPLAEAREKCRLRARWVQELTARVAREIGRRAARDGLLQDASDVTLMNLQEIKQMLSERKFPRALDHRGARAVSPPLPAAFRLTDSGDLIAEPTNSKPQGSGAGGGRGKGTVRHDPQVTVSGEVLIVRTLDPDLASVLPNLGGLVAETGSVLSHLAILAREFGVPTVVGVQDALSRFPEGSTAVIDGSSGDVSILEDQS